MQTLLEILLLAFTAAIVENVIFTRAMMQDFHRHYTRSALAVMLESVLITSYSVLASVVGWMGKAITRYMQVDEWAKSTMYITIYVLVVFTLILTTKIIALKKKRKFVAISALVFYGYIPVATTLVVAGRDYTVLEAVFYGLGVGVGYIIASQLNLQLQKRLLINEVPISFRGIPITLITFGIISLALFGLMGRVILL